MLCELNGKLEKRDGGYTQNIAIFISQYKEGGVVPFATNANTVGLPAQTTEWQYATGFFIKRQDEAFVVLLSRNNKIATNFFDGTTLSVWSIR